MCVCVSACVRACVCVCVCVCVASLVGEEGEAVVGAVVGGPGLGRVVADAGGAAEPGCKAL